MSDPAPSHRRLEQLYQVSKLLTKFGSADQTFDATLGVVARTLGLRSAILIEEDGDHFRMTVWPTEDQHTDAMRAAIWHLQSSFAYLVGATSTEALAVTQATGLTPLPSSGPVVRPALGVEPFIVIPLVVQGRDIFGAIQVEATRSFDESDLVFISSIGSQLAVAVDRDRARRHDIRRREHAEHLQASAEAQGADADQKRVVAERLSEQYLSLVDNLDHAFVWEANAETHQISFISARVEKLLGYAPWQWLGEAGDWMKFVHPADRRAVETTLRQALTEKLDQRCTHRCIALDGRVVWFDTGVHMIDTDGDHARLQGVSLDITSEKEAHDAKLFLLEATQTLGATLDYATALKRVARLALPRLGDFCFFDVVAADGGMRRAAWAHVDAVKQKTFDDTFERVSALPPDHPARRIVQTGKAELTPYLDTAVRVLALPPLRLSSSVDEQARSLLRVPVILGGRALGALTFAFAESNHRHGQSELELANELAQRAAFALENGRLYEQAQEAVQAREQVLELVSHDLRNPLGTVLMTISNMADRIAEQRESPSKELERMQRAATTMLRLINDLLDFESMAAGHLSMRMSLNDAAAVLAEVVASFEATAAAHEIQLVTELEPARLPALYCDRERILQVISNLVSNAIKIQSGPGRVTLRVLARGRELIFSVTDTGPGLSADDLGRLFQRYQRGTAVAYKGSGLGLAIAAKIIEQHRGRIWAEGELGRGATFYFALPAGDPDEPE